MAEEGLNFRFSFGEDLARVLESLSAGDKVEGLLDTLSAGDKVPVVWPDGQAMGEVTGLEFSGDGTFRVTMTLSGRKRWLPAGHGDMSLAPGSEDQE